ncbi:MAG: NADH-quinone oxidoreductase subunit NuoK [Thermoproteota archaeon]|nr:MAG: NADH-quinone oxidoreductase subunit NuoK [Candidatus Korarchaeota archaeon]RLG50101.1 MAG: NADH-quinone oxidoreductase subunit NuoK [Candidatus Korarchaeota archaeon]
MTAYWFLLTSVAMFCIGLYGLLTRRSLIRMLLSAEVIFNGALLALLSTASLSPAFRPAGGALALLAISLAAAEIGVIVSVAILMFRLRKSLDVYELRGE